MNLFDITLSWEQRKLGDFGKCKSGIGFPDSQQGGQTGIPFFKVSDMNTAGNEKIMHISNNYVTEQQITNNSWNVIKSPAVLFAKVGAAVMLNRKRLILSDFLLDNNTMTYPINTDSFDTDFCYTLFETIDLPSLVQVGALPSYNANQVDNIEVSIPNYLEQVKIGTIFNNIDNLITLHQRKYDKLVAVKKSLLEKMFPNDNSVFPDIRFKGYTEAWEQCELSKLGKIETGNTPSTTIEDYYSDTGLLWVTPTDIISNILVNTDKKLTSKGMAVARVIPANSILCTCIASIGKNAFLPVKCAFNQQINALTPYDGNHPYFLFTNSYNWSQTMKKGAGGLTFQIVNKTEFSNIKTYVPKYNEQKEIGDLFYKLDNLITLHQRKCEKLKNLKKSLLEKMFC